jgi:hypothetical protein
MHRKWISTTVQQEGTTMLMARFATVFLILIAWIGVAEAEFYYVLDHWEVVVAEEWNWGTGGMTILQEWDNVGAGTRTFSWSGEAEGGGRNAFGSMTISIPGVVPPELAGWGGWGPLEVAALGQASVKVPANESGFLRVGTICWSGPFNGYGSCNHESQDSGTVEGGGTVNLIARQEDTAGGAGMAGPPVVAFMATAGTRGRLGGYIQDIQQWTIRATAYYRTVSTPEPESITEAGDHGTTEQLPTSYTNPIVIVGPPTYRDPEPGVARVENVASDSFHIRFQEWSYLDGEHGVESMPFLVFEKGRKNLGAGAVLEAGSFEIGGTDQWQSVAFQKAFPGTPHLFLTVQTTNGTEAVTARARSVTASGFPCVFSL